MTFLCNTRFCILEMGDAPTFVIKGDVRSFVMGEGMGHASTFMIKGDTPLATRVSFDFIIGDAHHECASLFSQRSGRVLDINLTETRQNVDCLLLPSTEPVLSLTDAGTSHFSRSEMIAFARVFNMCLRFEFLT
jgi:hypothetical protein